jgi:hypothetical protein
LLCIAIIFIGIQFLVPENAGPALQSTIRFSGFFLISFSAIFLLPLLFIKLKLAEQT